MSIIVGVGKGAQHGILIKNAEAIETVEEITHLITDKTDTLTAGRPEIVDVAAAPGTTRRQARSSSPLPSRRNPNIRSPVPS